MRSNLESSRVFSGKNRKDWRTISILFRHANYIFIPFIIITFLACGNEQNPGSSILKIKDDMGREISINSIPKKVISCAPNITEMLFALQCENEIVGVTKWCIYPPEAAKKEIIGDLLNFNFEKIIALKPDMVFLTVEGNTKELFDKIESFGIKIFVSNPRNTVGIIKTIKDLSLIFKKEKIADSLVADIRNKIDSAKNDVTPKPKIVFLVSLVPLMVVGGNTFLDEIISLAGGENPISKYAKSYPSLSREEILKQNPDYILIPSDILKCPEEVLNIYPEWKNVNASRNNSIYIVDADLTQRPGIRCGDVVMMIANIIKNKNNRELKK